MLFDMNDNLILYENCVVRLEAILASSQTFKDIEGLLIDFILMDEKPLVYLLLHRFTLIGQLVTIICQTSDLNTRLSQLSLLCVGLKTDGEHARVWPDFILELYWNGLGLKTPVLLETGRQFLIKSLLETDSFNLELYDDITDNIIQKQHFDVALAYCLQRMPPFVFKKKSKQELYAYLMEGHDKTVQFNDAWWRVVHEKILYYQVFEKFMWLFFDLVTNIYIERPEKILRVSRALSSLIKKYDPTQVGSMDGLSLIDREKRSIYSFILKMDFESTFNPLVIVSMLSDCPESDIDVFLRFITTSGVFADVFRQIYFSFKEDGNIVDEFYKTEYIAKLSRALNRLNPKSIPNLSLDTLPLLNTRINANSLLMLLVLVSRNLANSTIIPYQKAWLGLSLALIEQVLVKGKGTPLEKTLTDLIETYDIHSFLPKAHQQAFLDLLQHPKQDWSLDDDRIQYLSRTLSIPEKPAASKKHKKKKKSQETSHVELADLSDQLDDASKMSSELAVSDTALLSGIPHQALSSDEGGLVFDDESSDEALSEREMHVEALSISPVLDTPVDSFYKQLKVPLKKISALLKQMKHIDLPAVWKGLVAEVNTGVTLINQIKQTKLETDEELKDTIAYASMDISEQLLLEQTWNRGVAFFCWDLQCAQQKYLQSQMTDAITQINSVSSSVLLSLSFCYFKNISLHLDKEIIAPIAAITLYLRESGYDLLIKGAFVFPEKLRDLDLFVIPRAEGTMVDAPHKVAQGLIEKFSPRLVSGSIFQNTGIWSQQLHFKVAETCEIDMDLIFSLQYLSAEQMQVISLSSVLSTMSVLWNIDGSACMVPMAARANCGNKRVLRPIIEIKTDAHWLQICGYLVKQLIKMGSDVCLSPELVKFEELYLNPTTRYASNPQSAEGLVVLNKKIIAEVLGYLLTRFTIRTHLSAQFIVEKQLLQGMFSLTPASSELCSSYFSSHFIPQEGEFQPTLSSPGFLAMLLLGAIIDQSPENKTKLIESLELSFVFCGASLKKIILSTITILNKLPHRTIDFYLENKLQASIGEGVTFADRAALMVLKLWHVKINPKINAETNLVASVTSEVRKNAPSIPAGRASQFFRPTPNEAASSTAPLASTQMVSN